jgi:hypothetical protein
VKASRKKGVENMREKNDAQFYFTVVCKDRQEKEALLRKIGLPGFELYVQGAYLDESLINRFGAKNRDGASAVDDGPVGSVE